jgi:uncharacterized phage protein gp47/JayE
VAYFAPYVDASGLHIPTYQDIEDYLVEQARAIYGSDIYLENDSQDFQFIAANALVMYDTLLSVQLAYNSRSPVTAVGTGLDGVVAINGLVREGATNSQVTVTLTGTAFTLITNGLVSDINGNVWVLPTSVTIEEDGNVTVTATAQASGAITALAGQVVIIQTPTLGWTSVTNPSAATPGRNAESDSELRARQQIAVANPSQGLTTGILGGVLSVAGVVTAQLYENDTSAPLSEINDVYNPYDFPAHSITLVVDGGDGQAIADAIGVRKTPGAGMSGDQVYTYTDRYGVPTQISFWRPIDTPIKVDLTITPLYGYTSAIGDAVKSALVNYLNSLTAGQSVIISELWQAALSADTASYPTFSLDALSAARDTDTLDTSNILLYFDEKASTTLPDITLNVIV